MHIIAQNISKVFELSTSGKALSMAKIMLGMQSHTTSSPEKRVAVDNVSLTIREGERVGIIGHNGAGKSTLLQMIAGLAEPTSGNIDVQGHVNCIMTLGVGLREELSGRENIYIDGELNGKQREETAGLIEQIIAFADIGEFIEYPVRTYSSGMKARLAFAMIIFIEPEILIIDEALSAGDARFVGKASAKMKEICGKGKILLVVSHSMQSIIDMCDRCIWMDHGKVVMDGPPNTVTAAYLEAVRTADELALKQKLKQRIGWESFVSGFTIKGIELLDDDSNRRTILSVGENFRLRLKLNVTSPADVGDIRLHIERTDGVVIIDNLASSNGASIPALCAASTIEIPLGHLSLGKNTYEVTAELLGQMDNSGETPPVLARCREIFRIDNAEYPYENPVCWHAAEWSFEEHGNY